MQRGLSKQLKKEISSIKAEIIVTEQSLKAAEALVINLKSPHLKGIASDQVCRLNQKLAELNKALSHLKR